jgi:hypothetical protein
MVIYRLYEHSELKKAVLENESYNIIISIFQNEVLYVYDSESNKLVPYEVNNIPFLLNFDKKNIWFTNHPFLINNDIIYIPLGKNTINKLMSSI